MKIIFAFLIFQLLLSCDTADHPLLNKAKANSNKANYNKALPDVNFSIDSVKILKDFATWYDYTFHNVRLSQDFIGLNIESLIIDKATFLNQLMTEDVVALKIKPLQGIPVNDEQHLFLI